jgi:hypothetical protein
MEKTNNFKLPILKKLFNLKDFNKVLLILAIFLSVYYIAGTNDLAIKGFKLNELKKQQSKLADENKKLELNIMALSSYNNISQRIDNLKMVAVGNIDYISSNLETVAKK